MSLVSDERIEELLRKEAEIERLRAALAECVPFNRDACIEECARVAEREEFWDYLKPQAHIAAAIRHLKENPHAIKQEAAAIRALKDKP